MTNYNDKNWHGWNGGEYPVHPKSKVEVVIRDPEGLARLSAGIADSFRWEHQEGYANIIAFRVVKEHREPREFWMAKGVLSGQWSEARSDWPGAVLFREVLE